MSLYVDEQRKNRTLEGEERNLRANLNLPKFFIQEVIGKPELKTQISII